MTKLNSPSKIKYAVIIGLLLVSVAVASRIFSGSTASSASETKKSDSSVAGDRDTKMVELDSSIDIPINKEDDSIMYKVVSAKLTDQVVIQGQQARAVEGRQFLILNLKISNSHEDRVTINTRDFVRLSAVGVEDKLAPSIHNDPVEIQPISDQFTLLGFSVSDTDTDFVLYLGEVSEDKIEVNINFN